MGEVYKRALAFKRRYPMTIAWRLKKNSARIEDHLNSDETVKYVFAGQKNNNPFDILSTCVIAITNKRILIGRDRVVVGYFLDSITPDLFNDLKVLSGIIWGKVHIDTVKEFVTISNLDKKSLKEIETEVSTYVMREKKKYPPRNDKAKV